MLGFLITLLVLIGLSGYVTVMSYMRTRDVIARDANNDAMNEILSRQGYAIILQAIGILLMVVKIGTLI